MSDMQIESEYVSAASHDDSSSWQELPLSQLRRMYTSPEEIKFLENEIVAKQAGRRHPQDQSGTNKEMTLYWVFKECTDVTRNRNQVGTRLSVRGDIPNNKAAKAAVAEGLLASAANFGGKGMGHESAGVCEKGAKGGKGAGKAAAKPKPKQKKVGVVGLATSNLKGLQSQPAYNS